MTWNRSAGHTHAHANMHAHKDIIILVTRTIYIYACNIHTLCVAVVSSVVVNRSDFEQQFDGHYAV